MWASLSRMEREAFSMRGAERAYGVSRTRLSEAVRTGELPASQLGARRFTILRSDLEAWFRRYAVPRSPHAEAVVNRVLEREGRAASG